MKPLAVSKEPNTSTKQPYGVATVSGIDKVTGLRWPQLVGSIKLHVSFVKEPYKRDGILRKRPIIDGILSQNTVSFIGLFYKRDV